VPLGSGVRERLDPWQELVTGHPRQHARECSSQTADRKRRSRGLVVEGSLASAVPSSLESTRDAKQGHTHPACADGSRGVIDTARQRAIGQVSLVGTGSAVIARTGQFEILVRGAFQAVEVVGSGGLARSRSHVVPFRSGRRSCQTRD